MKKVNTIVRVSVFFFGLLIFADDHDAYSEIKIKVIDNTQKLSFKHPIVKQFMRTRRNERVRRTRFSVEKNSWADFQVLLKGDECVSVTIDADVPLKSKVYRALPVQVVNPSFKGATTGFYWDTLIPLDEGGEICPIKGEPSLLWVELGAPAEVASTSLQAALRIGRFKVPLSVQVLPTTLPERTALHFLAPISQWALQREHYGRYVGEAEAAPLTQKYLQAMRAHGIIPFDPDIAVSARSDREGLAIETFPTRENSLYELLIKDSHPTDPISFPRPDFSKSDEEIASYFTAIESTIKQYRLENRAIMYIADEPRERHVVRLVQVGVLARAYAPTLRLMMTTQPDERLRPYVDINNPIINFLDSRRESIFLQGKERVFKEYQRDLDVGRPFWTYISCMSNGCLSPLSDRWSRLRQPDLSIETPTAFVRVLSFMARQYGFSRIFLYDTIQGYRGTEYWGGVEHSAFKDIYHYGANGDGQLFYPGKAGEFGLREHGPLPSIRLKLIRQVVAESHLLKLMDDMARVPSWWKKTSGTICRTTRKFEKDQSAYEALMKRVKKRIVKAYR